MNGFKNDSSGVGIGIVNYADNYTGGQLAAFNWTKGNFLGAQFGFVNFVQGKASGLQFGAVNYAKAVSGVQLGLVNYTESMESGLQIGVANIITDTTTWFSEFPNRVAPAMIIANWHFGAASPATPSKPASKPGAVKSSH